MKRLKSYSGKKPEKWPDLILFVHYYADDRCIAEVDCNYVEQRKPFILLQRCRNNGIDGFTPLCITDCADDWWTELRAVCRRHKRAMIFAYDLPTLWKHLDFWEELDNGRIMFVHPGICNRPGNDESMAGEGAGILVASDPPAFAIHWIEGVRATIEWTDLRNYGYLFDLRGMERSEYLGTAIDCAESWLTTIAQHKLGGPRFTAASQAFEAWRTAPFPWKIRPSQDSKVLEMESRAVYGGRCEVYRKGVFTWPTYHLDFTSLYPSVMLEHEMPVALDNVCGIRNCPWEAEPDNDRIYIADCTVRTDKPHYPLRIDGAVIYPIGVFRTVLPDPDYRHALEHNHIVETHRVNVYRTAPIFRPIIEKLWTLRQTMLKDANANFAGVIKLLMNSLSGKFNQREAEWTDRPDLFCTKPYGSEWVFNQDHSEAIYCRIVNWMMQELREGPYGRFSFPAITSHIMAVGRWKLQSIMSLLKTEELLYCDTDSVVVTWEGRERLSNAGLIRSGDLGFLREKDRWNHLEIKGPKHYNADGKMVCAGFPKHSRWMGGTKWRIPVRKLLEGAIAEGDPRTVGDSQRDYHFPGEVWNRVLFSDGSTAPIKVNGAVYDGCRA